MMLRSTTDKYRGVISRPIAGNNSKAAVADAGSPFLIEFFMVQGAGFQCMAYRNADGKWRSAFDHRELPGTVRVLD